MYAQLTYFDSPCTPEQVAASDFAGRERIQPAVSDLGHRFRVYKLRRDDGSEIVVTIADSEQDLLGAQKAIMSTGLLPGEDQALLPGPDRIELYPVLEVHDLGPAVTGNVPITEGTMDVDESGRPRAISGSLDLGAIDTGNPRRDKDLRKPRFLDLDRYPAMTFAADSIAADSITASPAGWRVTGTLAVRGTSVRLAGDAAASSHEGSATVTAHTRLDRRALGIRAPGIMIGHAIDITVTAALRLTAQQ